MKQLFSSLLFSLLLLLGNFFLQTRSINVLTHVASLHSSVSGSHHNHDHNVEEPSEHSKKENTQHNHDLELASLSLPLFLSMPHSKVLTTSVVDFALPSPLALNQLSLLSFSFCIFRPPIS